MVSIFAQSTAQYIHPWLQQSRGGQARLSAMATLLMTSTTMPIKMFMSVMAFNIHAVNRGEEGFFATRSGNYDVLK